jgi:hypothetical protein
MKIYAGATLNEQPQTDYTMHATADGPIKEEENSLCESFLGFNSLKVDAFNAKRGIYILRYNLILLIKRIRIIQYFVICY